MLAGEQRPAQAALAQALEPEQALVRLLLALVKRLRQPIFQPLQCLFAVD